MPLNQPFKICNDQHCNVLSMTQQQDHGAFRSVLRDCVEVYELYLYVSGMDRFDPVLFIEDHVLHVTLYARSHDPSVQNSFCVWLPLAVNENIVSACLKPYGIKITLPKRIWQKTGVRIKVPLTL